MVTPSGKQILIDGGPNLQALEQLARRMPFFDRTIDLVILTHPDADHITALPEVLRRFRVSTLLLTKQGHSSGAYDALLYAAHRSGTHILHPNPSVDLNFGDGVVLDTVWPSSTFLGSSNNRSIVVRALYNDSAILYTGDIEEKAEIAILKTGADIRSDVLKVAHHGSRTSSSTGFVLSVRPSLALLSVGKDNRFGHPHADIVERYRMLGIPKKTTADSGMISLEF